MSRPAVRQVIIRARDLDTGASETATREVPLPADEQRKRLQLIEIVESLHPAAQIRSFANDAASFLGPRQLVVAHYGDEVMAAEPEAPIDHLTLFRDVA